MKKQGLSIVAISAATGFDRKTVRKYLQEEPHSPRYRDRPAEPGKLERFKPYLERRMNAGVWNAAVLLRELKDLGYTGGYTLLTDWLRPQRKAAAAVAVRRFETAPGEQAQVDWGHLGSLAVDGVEHKLWCFTMTLGYSRLMWAGIAVDQKLGTLIRMHEEAFRELGGVPRTILYDRMRTVWDGHDERGEIVWNAVFHDFAGHWGFKPRLCRPYRAQTKGKVESGVKYIRRNFLCGLLGRQIGGMADLKAELRKWLCSVANVRVHGTTHEPVMERWAQERGTLLATANRPAYPFADEELRKVATDAFVNWDASRYSVPWQYAGKQVWVREHEAGRVEVRYGDRRVADHDRAERRHEIVRKPEHHEGIPTGPTRPAGKTLIHVQATAPEVEQRSLDVYEACAGAAA